MEGMKAYNRYQALKLHFTTDYDFVKYGGKVRKISEEAFLKRKDQFLFRKLERKYDDEELTNFFVANFVSNAGVRWVGEMNGPESEKIYMAWLKRFESFSYFLKEDLEKLFDDCNNSITRILLVENTHPLLLKKYMSGRITAETVIAFDIVFDVLEKWNEQIEDTIVWPELYLQLTKYRPFVKIEKSTIKKVMRDVFSS
jgi:hypothetical protein